MISSAVTRSRTAAGRMAVATAMAARTRAAAAPGRRSVTPGSLGGAPAAVKLAPAGWAGVACPLSMAPPQFSLRRSLAYSALLVLAFFAGTEGLLRRVGVRPAARPRLILRSIDSDIDLPFMRADAELFWSPRPGWRGTFQDRPVT